MDITRIRPHINQGGGQTGWEDHENNRHYCRIWAGATWPDKGASGFLVVIGEGWSTNTAPALYGLIESSHRNFDGILSKAAELLLVTDRFYARTSDAQNHLLHQFNRNQAKTQVGGLRVYDPPLVKERDPTELFSYVDADLDRRTSGGQKSVFLEACPLTLAALQRVLKGWKNIETILDLPEVTALYYVLGAMFLFPYKDPEPPGRTKPYDPLTSWWDDDYDPLKF